mmetsp:Transcript_27576/g.57792  ORF Transcript_27576/g.57792 Transcript_27576/m.57792 type:complete len:157 (+) Transcript_27576:468-938(+)
MLTQPEAYSTHYVPSVVSATTATTPSGLAHSAVDNRLDKMEGMIQSIQQIVQLQQRQRGTHTNGSRHNNRNGWGTVRGDPNGPWRQWKYWCYSCGTNLSHNTIDCHRTKNQLPDHDQFKTTATRDNPQGGNSKKDHLWLKWCDPGTYEPCSTKGGE